MWRAGNEECMVHDRTGRVVGEKERKHEFIVGKLRKIDEYVSDAVRK